MIFIFFLATVSKLTTESRSKFMLLAPRGRAISFVIRLDDIRRTHHPRPLWNNDIYIPSGTARGACLDIMKALRYNTLYTRAMRDYLWTLSGSLLASTGRNLHSARTWYILSFKPVPIVNEQISAIYDNCKSRQRASGILCKMSTARSGR